MCITYFRLKRIYVFLDYSKKYKIKYFCYDCKVDRKEKKKRKKNF